MKSTHKYLLALLSMLCITVSPAYARSLVPIVDIEDTSIASASSKTLTLNDMRAALSRAGALRHWQIVHIASGRAEGTLSVRQHMIRVEITYTKHSISIRYKDSTNMDYSATSGGQPVIHSKYNAWVQNLLSDLRVELSRL